jgi:hypothetical protein
VGPAGLPTEAGQEQPVHLSHLRCEISALAGPNVLVAPGRPELPDRVVATAWTWRLRCSAVNVEPIRAFIEERVGAATGH